MSLTVLSVAYPLGPVTPDAVGGAEQIVSHLDGALVEAGHRSVVVACAGSQVRGTLVPTPWPAGAFDGDARLRAWASHRLAIAEALRRFPVDLVHMHGLDFDAYMPPPGVAALVTLHLPVGWYAPGALRTARPGTWFNCVSQSQQRTAPSGLSLLPAIPNGVPVRALSAQRYRRRGFALQLARICREKGIDIALDASERAHTPLLIGGALFPYGDHVRYFEEVVRPRLNRERRFLGSLRFRQKRRLLGAARCLLVPSTAPETSSLVAMEAAACGTPVVALANGALPEVVEDGRTGFVVREAGELAAAIARVGEIDAEECRAVAAERFDVAVMGRRYLSAYEAIVSRRPIPPRIPS